MTVYHYEYKSGSNLKIQNAEIRFLVPYLFSFKTTAYKMAFTKYCSQILEMFKYLIFFLKNDTMLPSMFENLNP